MEAIEGGVTAPQGKYGEVSSDFNGGDDNSSSIEVISGPPSATPSMESSQTLSISSTPAITSGDEVIEKPSASQNQEGETEKLTGWLKLSGQGFRKAVKKFWFVYGDDTGKLYYYRHPQDLLPVGEIDLRNSSLTYDASNRDKPGVFEISSGGKIYSLDALDRNRMFYWLDALQKKRRNLSLRDTTRLQDILRGKRNPFDTSGLINQGEQNGNEVTDNLRTNDVELRGSHSGRNIRPSEDTSKSMLLNLREELRKTFTNFRSTTGSDKAYSSTGEEAWSLIDDRPPLNAALRQANRDIDQSLSQTRWHLTLSESVSSSSPPESSSVEDLLELNFDAASSSCSISRRATGPRPNVPPPTPPPKRNSNLGSEDRKISSKKYGEWQIPESQSTSEICEKTPAPVSPSCASSSSHTVSKLASNTLVSSAINVQNQTGSKSKTVASSLPSSIPSNQSQSNSQSGGSKFMNALRNFKINKEPAAAKERSKTEVSLALPSEPTPVPTKHRNPSFGSIFGYSKPESQCASCKSLQEDMSGLEEELEAHREIVGLLQKEVDFLRTFIRTSDSIANEGQSGVQEILNQKDKHIVELEYCRQGLLDEKSVMEQDLRVKNGTSLKSSELQELYDQISMYQHTLSVKDDIIVSLTNENQVLQKNTGMNVESGDGAFVQSPQVTSYSKLNLAEERRELETLRDACRAYEAQNKFLTSEILEQKALRENDEARERVYIMKVASLEAKYYKTLSQYLYILKENEAPVRGGDESNSQDVVSRLLEEALETEAEQASNENQSEPNNKRSSEGGFVASQGKEYDDYGFLKYDMNEDGVLLCRAQMLERQSTELEFMIRDADDVTSKKIKWENFMVGITHSGRGFTRSPELKALLRLGVPTEFRQKVWRGCIDLHVKSVRIKLGDKYYIDLQERAQANKSNPAIKQIELDLLRTLPDNCFFQKIDSEGICKLRRVLLCYSVHNPCIGYCQGINRLAAIALLFLTEEEAFWCLVTIIDHLMPADYYTATLAGAQADQRVLKDLVAEKCPRLHAHLELHEVDLSLFTFNWFLTVFVDNIFPQLFLSIWDVFLYEGNKILFRYGLAFLKYSEEEILKQPNNLSINRYMRTLGQNLYDVRRINAIAFSDLNPFPMRNVSNKRQFHLHQIKAELEELEAIRKDIKSSHKAAEDTFRDADPYTSDGDLDDDAS